MLTRFTSLALFTALFGVAGLVQAQDISQTAPAYGTQSNTQYGSQSGSQSNQQDSHPHWLINQVFGGESSANNRATTGSNSSQSGSPSYGTSGSGSSNNGTSGNGTVSKNFANPQASGTQSSNAQNNNSQNGSSVRSAQSRLAYPSNSQRATGQPTLAPAPLYGSGTTGVPAQPVPDTQTTSPRDNRPLAERLRQSADHGPIVSSGTVEKTPEAPAVSSRRVARLDVAEEVSVPADPAADHITHNTRAEETAVSGPAKFVASSRRSIPAADIGTQTAEAAPLASNNVLVNHQSPQLSVETIGPRTIMIGKEATYKVVLKNTGDVAAQEVVVGVKIPEWTDVAGTQVSAGAARSADAEGLQWRVPRLDARSKETLTLRLVPRKGKPFDLAVQWTFTPVTEQTVVEVQEPKLAMSIAGPDEITFGQSKIYRLTVSNPGTGPAENVSIQLAPIGNPHGAPTHQALGNLKAGDSKVVELELTARQAGNITIHAAAAAEPGLKAESTQEVLVRRPAVAVAVDGAKVKYAGTTAMYTIQISNPGNATAENVHVLATLPPEAKFVSASGNGQWKSEQAKVVWTLPNLKAGDTGVMELKCTLMAPGPNRIQIASSATGDVSDTANITTHVEALADLKLNVSEPAGPIAVGDDVVYELKIRNRGSKSAEGVGVVAYFSEGIEPTSAQGGPHDIANGVVAFHPLASLPVGGEVVFKIHAKAQRTGKQVFRAEVECNTLGTKLVSAEETNIYGDEIGGMAHSHEAIASRVPAPADAQPPAQMPIAPNQAPQVMPMQIPGGQPAGAYGLRR
jgi:uncharacterized repeat protein (TIGR01451 family)